VSGVSDVAARSTGDGRSAGVRRALLIEPDYRGHRIEVNAQHVDGAWNAEVRIRRILYDGKPHVEIVTCRKPTAKVAEERGLVYGHRWVDLHGAKV